MATKNVIKKIIKDGVEYFIYSTKGEVEVDSALSDTSENPVQNKVVKGAIDGKITNPSGGTKGQVLTKTANGESWQDAQGGLPEGGNEGQFIRKTATGSEWVDGELVEIKADDYSALQGPAPSGFHVPLKTEWQGLRTIMSGLSLTTGNNWRVNLHLPFAGRRDPSNAGVVGQNSFSYYWSSTPSGTSNANYLFMNSSSTNVIDYTRASGFSIRCFKNSFEVPTSSWTVINGTLGGAGIFRDTVNGLISITSDGTTGYTIQDKNLGATTVYSDGDTLSEANCGKYYQWGNNYGFAWTGTITNSSTQVNAGSYGPGNYYSGSTFRTGSNDWSSVQNDNLRGGVTGILNSKYAGGEKINEVPSIGATGQVLTKTASGYEFSDNNYLNITAAKKTSLENLIKNTPVYTSVNITPSYSYGGQNPKTFNLFNTSEQSIFDITLDDNYDGKLMKIHFGLPCNTLVNSSITSVYFNAIGGTEADIYYILGSGNTFYDCRVSYISGNAIGSSSLNTSIVAVVKYQIQLYKYQGHNHFQVYARGGYVSGKSSTNVITYDAYNNPTIYKIY